MEHRALGICATRVPVPIIPVMDNTYIAEKKTNLEKDVVGVD